MFYYKSQDGVLIKSDGFYKDGYTRITEDEYNSLLEGSRPTEEEIRAEKEAQLKALMAELYPEKEEG